MGLGVFRIASELDGEAVGRLDRGLRSYLIEAIFELYTKISTTFELWNNHDRQTSLQIHARAESTVCSEVSVS